MPLHLRISTITSWLVQQGISWAEEDEELSFLVFLVAECLVMLSVLIAFVRKGLRGRLGSDTMEQWSLEVVDEENV